MPASFKVERRKAPCGRNTLQPVHGLILPCAALGLDDLIADVKLLQRLRLRRTRPRRRRQLRRHLAAVAVQATVPYACVYNNISFHPAQLPVMASAPGRGAAATDNFEPQGGGAALHA